MPAPFRKSRVSTISTEGWDRIAKLFQTAGEGHMPHDIGNRAGISYAAAHALIIALTADGLVDTSWLVYHRGCPDAGNPAPPVAERAFRDGFVEEPWTCPYCEGEVDPDDLRYDLYCKTKQPITFESDEQTEGGA